MKIKNRKYSNKKKELTIKYLINLAFDINKDKGVTNNAFTIINIILIVLYISITEQFLIKKLRVSDSEIRITIRGNGSQYILNNKSYYSDGKLKYSNIPSEILINL